MKATPTQVQVTRKHRTNHKMEKIDLEQQSEHSEAFLRSEVNTRPKNHTIKKQTK